MNYKCHCRLRNTLPHWSLYHDEEKKLWEKFNECKERSNETVKGKLNFQEQKLVSSTKPILAS